MHEPVVTKRFNKTKPGVMPTTPGSTFGSFKMTSEPTDLLKNTRWKGGLNVPSGKWIAINNKPHWV